MERAGPRRAAGLSRHGDPVRVSAEPGNVLLHPLASLAHVIERIVAGGSPALGGEIRVGEEPQEAQAVIDGDHHHILPFGEARPVAHHLASAARHHAAAVDPEEHGQLVLRRLRRGPDVQVQTVLLVLGGRQELGHTVDVGGRLRQFHDLLDGGCGILGSPAYAPPAARVLGMTEPQRAHGGRRVGDPLEDFQPVLRVALEPPLCHADLCLFKITHRYDLLHLKNMYTVYHSTLSNAG